MKTKKKQKGGKYYKSLVSFDSVHYGYNPDIDDRLEDCYAWKINDLKHLSIALATYCYDNSFDVDEDSWNLLRNIEREFGVTVRNKVLYNLFHRKHDT